MTITHTTIDGRGCDNRKRVGEVGMIGSLPLPEFEELFREEREMDHELHIRRSLLITGGTKICVEERGDQ